MARPQVVKAQNVNSNINVTPLVDVMLVLLIIFMVVTPMLQKGQAVKLPSTADPQKVPEDSKQILVVVNHNKQYWIEKEGPMEEGAFQSKIVETYQRNPASSIVIKADKMLEFGVVKKTMLSIRDAGFQQVGLVSSKKQ
jgi:biopolymer transport protein ExbD